MRDTRVDRIRQMFPAGCRVKLVLMYDEFAPPVGTEGTVRFVDDMGNVHVSWDNGSCLASVYGFDIITKA